MAAEAPRIFAGPPVPRVLELLDRSGLPVDDIDERMAHRFLGCGDDTRPGGVAGLELAGRYGLLRSLAVDDAVRGRGCGRALVAGVERHAAALGVEALYLLTETAERFFRRLGYDVVARGDVPDDIRRTREFSSLCPDSAVVMAKGLPGARAAAGR